MGDANPTNPEVPTMRADNFAARAEALRTELESAGLVAPTADELISLLEDGCRAVADLEERLAAAERSLMSTERRLAEEIERQDALRSRLALQEKLASLGALAARIAHEIRNHLNFVNNFAEIVVNLANELDEVMAPELAQLPDQVSGDFHDLMTDIDEAAKKIRSHGRTSVDIVANMLRHSRGGQPEFAQTDLNALVDESLRLAYHGVRAQHPGFDVSYSADLDERLSPVSVAGQDISRVLLNVLGNAFDAVMQRAQQDGEGYQPRVQITTRSVDDSVEILVRDNGIGIEQAVLSQVITPFFTTKPPGQGTGLGLSISYDVVKREHHGDLTIESEQGVGTSVRIVLPKSQPSS
ncbi:GHKL domain-containing protein [Mycobacterium shinjukuense]|uniref:histidine kinase n=1 Tax=Mycobacterium shinjukuense TaxID=398694 RepID=A0A7I7MWE4_9MYCO|nr:ATP-binding protein [Mycobacterium shinjukuense]MCV6984521.1 GHKL domain-containing protein [Mycobacterium shinjukuense]ORB65918.1 hypothetical protein BST45_14415 [Mycobacterium shinjukuense]BBX76180.1 hypothetical protein MSHI_40860 [Mycobacterium shinjukuense]